MLILIGAGLLGVGAVSLFLFATWGAERELHRYYCTLRRTRPYGPADLVCRCDLGEDGHRREEWLASGGRTSRM